MKEMLIFRNFLPARSRQLAKKMESSRATAKHIRQVTCDLPAAQIHLMCHQHTKLLARNYNKHKKVTKQKAQNHRPTEQMSKKSFDLWKLDKPSDRCIRCSDTLHAKGFQCPAKKFQCKVCHANSATSLQSVTKRINRHQAHLSLGNLRHTNFEQGPYTLIKMQIAIYLKSQVLMNRSVYR